MKLIITDDKEKYLINNNEIKRPKLMTYSELKKLLYTPITNFDVLDQLEYEYKQVIMKNINYVTNEVNSELYNLKTSLGIKEVDSSFLNHYEIYSDIILDDVIKNKLPKVTYNFSEVTYSNRYIHVTHDLYAECQFVTNKIAELVNDGVDINEVKVIVPNSDYENTLRLTLLMNNIAVITNDSYKIMTNSVVKKLVTLNTVEDIIEESNNITNNTIKSKVISILNNERTLSDIKASLKKATVKSENTANGVTISGINNYNSNYVFVMGVYETSYSLDVRDNDFYTDIEKEKLGLKTSIIKSYEKHQKFINIVNSSYLITRPLVDINGEVKDVYGFNIIEDNNIFNYIEESESYNLVNYSNLERMYGEVNERLKLIKEDVTLVAPKDFSFQKYSFDFTPRISASSIEMYNKCQYSYYLRYVLKLYAKKTNMWNLELGTFTHHILEYGYSNDDIIEEINRYVVKQSENIDGTFSDIFNDVEKQIIKNMSDFLVKLVNHTKKQFDILCKLELEKEIHAEDINLIGFIDKYIELDDKFMILDYKTGNAKLNFDFIHHGIEIQNMLYAYIIEKNNPGLKLAGTFRQKAKPRVLNYDDSFNKEYNINGKLLDNKMVDYEFVNIRRTKAGKLYKASELTNIGLYYNLIEENIEKVIKSIGDNNFNIDPKKHKDIVNACKYCDYSEICYKTDNTYIIIDKLEVSDEI